MKICVIGLGYMGIPTSILFGREGCEVVGVECRTDVVESLNNGIIPIEEDGLEDILKDCLAKKSFKATATREEADTFIVCVPTPHKNDGLMSCDLTFVLQAVEETIPFLRKGNVLIVESTIAPRSIDDYVVPIIEKAGFVVGTDIFVAHCPERVLPGNILHELVYNNRIVGGVTPKCADMAASVYAMVVKGEIVKTEAKTAEFSKCMENTFRDINIAIANELTKVCFELGINSLEVIEMANKHPRVNILKPGPGVGGHCIAVDPYFIYSKAPQTAKLVKNAREINDSMPEFVVEKIEMLLKKVEQPKICIFGLAFKGNVDDYRESPAIEVLNKLKEKKYNCSVYDPLVKLPDCGDLDKAVSNADIIVVLTDHKIYATLDLTDLARKMKNALLFDTRGIIPCSTESDMTIVNYGNLYQYK